MSPLKSQLAGRSTSREGSQDASAIESEAETERRENADAMNEVIMAVDMRERGTVGCAYYVARDEKLCLMEDIKMAGLEVVDTLKLHVEPTTVLISTKAEEALERHLMKEARGLDQGEEGETPPPFTSLQSCLRLQFCTSPQ